MLAGHLTKNFLYLLLSNIVGQLFTLLAFVHLATVFGPEAFGKFSFAQVVSLYFLYLADFGLQTLGTREVARDRTVIAQLVQRISAGRIATSFGAFSLLVLFALFLDKPFEVRLLILIFGTSIFPSSLLLEWVFQGLERMDLVAVGRVLRGLVFVVLAFLFASSEASIHLAAAFYVCGIGAATIALMAIYLREFGWPGVRIRGTTFRQLFVMAIPLAVGSVVTQVNYNFGTFALGLYSSDYDIGLYSAAHKVILFLWAFVVVAASNAVLPLLVKTHKDRADAAADITKKLLRWFAIAGVPLGVGGTVLAESIMRFLYPESYVGAAIVLEGGIWIVVIVLLRVVFENALLAGSHEKRYLRGYVGGGIVTILGNLLLVPHLGLVAPIAVSIVAESALLVYFGISSGLASARLFARLLVGPLTAAVVMGLTLSFLPLPLLVLVPIGVVVYLLMLVLLRVVSPAELVRSAASLVR